MKRKSKRKYRTVKERLSGTEINSWNKKGIEEINCIDSLREAEIGLEEKKKKNHKYDRMIKHLENVKRK